MTWLEVIQSETPEWIAEWSHKIEAFALIEGKVDSKEELLEYLFSEAYGESTDYMK